jgi:IrrE N-terminal-like domain
MNPIVKKSEAKGFKVKPLSMVRIKDISLNLRKSLSFSKPYLEINNLLDVLSVKDIIEYKVVNNKSLGTDLAGNTNSDGLILLPEDTYNQACNGNVFARFTIAHEIGHSVLHRGQINFARYKSTSKSHKSYEDSEWQANEFAGQFLAPISHIDYQDNISTIMSKFGVGKITAKIRMERFKDIGTANNAISSRKPMAPEYRVDGVNTPI